MKLGMCPITLSWKTTQSELNSWRHSILNKYTHTYRCNVLVKGKPNVVASKKEKKKKKGLMKNQHLVTVVHNILKWEESLKLRQRL